MVKLIIKYPFMVLEPNNIFKRLNYNLIYCILIKIITIKRINNYLTNISNYDDN